MITGAFFTGFFYDGRPYTADAGKQNKLAGYDADPTALYKMTPVNIPFWITRGTLHRALWYLEGPYTPVDGLYTVEMNEAMVYWEIRQGTPEWTPPPERMIPVIYAILPINRRFVSEGSLLHKAVDPDFIAPTPGDPMAVWMPVSSPAFIAGQWRKLTDDSVQNRDNSGRMQ